MGMGMGMGMGRCGLEGASSHRHYCREHSVPRVLPKIL